MENVISIMQKEGEDPVIAKARQDSSFRAVKQLVAAEQSLRVAHNRIKALNINEEKTNQRMQNQLALLSKIDNTRQAASLHHSRLVATQKAALAHTQQVHNKNQQFNTQHRTALRQVSNSILRQKQEQYLSREQESKLAEQAIKAEQERERRQKWSKRSELSAQQQKGRQHLMQFHNGRQSHIKQTKAGEVAALRQAEAKRQEELKQLNRVEMELLQRQANSQAAYQQVKGRLDSLLGTLKRQSSECKNLLKPSIHLRTRGSEQSD